MDRYRSSLSQDDSLCFDDKVFLYQTGFNSLEAQRRLIQFTIDKDPLYFAPIALGKSIEAVNEEFQHLISEDRDFSRVTRYADSVNLYISSFQPYKPNNDPDFINSEWGGTGYLGFRCEQPFGKSGKALSSLLGLSFGMGLFYDDVFFGGEFSARDGSLRGERFFHDKTLDYEWKTGAEVNALSGCILTGYRVIDKDYISILPTVGLGLNLLRQEVTSANKDDNLWSKIYGFRGEFGLMSRIKIFRVLYAALDNTGGRHYSETCLNLRLFGARTQCIVIDGYWSINFGVTLDFNYWDVQ
jgi:hypothetical protein